MGSSAALLAAFAVAFLPSVATFAPHLPQLVSLGSRIRTRPASCCLRLCSPPHHNVPDAAPLDLKKTSQFRRQVVAGLLAGPGLWASHVLSPSSKAQAAEPRMDSGLFYAKWPYVQPADILPFIYATAEKGNIDSILKAMDEFGTYYPMYKLGEEKGAILEQQLDLLPAPPRIAVELGCFLGYSALRTARHLAEGGQMYCLEYNPMHAEVAKKVVEYGGLGGKVTFVVGVSTEMLPKVAPKMQGADFVLLDHAKDIYLKDLQLMEKLKVVRKGTVIAADNVVYPGAPGYLEYVGGPGYKTNMVKAKFEYDQNWRQGWTPKEDALSFSLKLA